MFFPEEKKKYHNEERSKKLADILFKARRVLAKPKTWKDWNSDFTRVIKATSEERVDAVLEWLKDHARDKYTPLVFSAHSFATKFLQIEEAMLRHRRENGTLLAEKDPVVDALVQKLTRYRAWPVTDAQFYQLIRRQVKAHRDWTAILAERLESPTCKSKHAFLRSLLQKMGSPSTYLFTWMEEVGNTLDHLGLQWCGSFESFLLGPYSKKFTKQIRHLALEWSSDQIQFVEDLLERWKNESSEV